MLNQNSIYFASYYFQINLLKNSIWNKNNFMIKSYLLKTGGNMKNKKIINLKQLPTTIIIVILLLLIGYALPINENNNEISQENITIKNQYCYIK